MTRGVNNAYVAKFNSQEKWDTLDNKVEFLKYFDGYHNRAWLDLNTSTFDDFEHFFKTNPRVVAKPVDGIGGKGIEFFDFDGTNAKTVYDSMRANNQTLAEAYIIQDERMGILHPRVSKYCTNCYTAKEWSYPNSLCMCSLRKWQKC
ncbi:hypothetical protein MGH68_07570 [Erysipelothrix sp. D19-032]